ncbi:glycosyltransferase [Achromobacter sp. HZ01]|uniref:CgeB family protein n=1 Tax=Achromobacter sp. HZ01 TaxID=1416886 RepID=UPI000DD0E452|nr:glycosyltransferase [Achromobacter sp. HZ01]
MKIALIADALTTSCLRERWHVINVTPLNYRLTLRYGKPDFLFVESAWQGDRDRWKYKIASYPDHPQRNNGALRKVVTYARDLGIPTVFWNKEDSVHFDRFIDSARFFEHIFTVDENCVPRYIEATGGNASVDTLPFAVESKFHYFKGFSFEIPRANFVGSYSRHIHTRRRLWQEMMFTACAESGMPINVYDRNSNRQSSNYRYPSYPGLVVNPAVPYAETGEIYRKHLVSLNVNTVEDSPTMYSRRLVEILACGGIAVTNPSLAVDRYFSDYCHIVSDIADCRDLIKRLLKDGPTSRDQERARAGAEVVRKRHSWDVRLELIRNTVGI